jgi:hypothetical protein
MQMQEVQTDAAAVGVRPNDAEEFMRLILKLRWIGLDDEADRLQRVVHAFGTPLGAPAQAGPTCTD